MQKSEKLGLPKLRASIQAASMVSVKSKLSKLDPAANGKNPGKGISAATTTATAATATAEISSPFDICLTGSDHLASPSDVFDASQKRGARGKSPVETDLLGRERCETKRQLIAADRIGEGWISNNAEVAELGAAGGKPERAASDWMFTEVELRQLQQDILTIQRKTGTVRLATHAHSMHADPSTHDDII